MTGTFKCHFVHGTSTFKCHFAMTKMSNPLPWDFFRCQPQQVDKQCKNCRRWADQEGQTFGPRTAFVQVTRSKSEACAYLPISFLEENT